MLPMFSHHGYIGPPHNSLTAEKARETLREVKETQEVFKKQRETTKLEAEVLCTHYSFVPVAVYCTVSYFHWRNLLFANFTFLRQFTQLLPT